MTAPKSENLRTKLKQLYLIEQREREGGGGGDREGGRESVRESIWDLTEREREREREREYLGPDREECTQTFKRINAYAL